MKRLALTVAIALALWAPSAAYAEFGITDFDVTFTAADGAPVTQAGAHPFAMTTSFRLNHTGENAEAIAEGKLRDLLIDQVPGFAGDATTVPHCSTADFLAEAAPPESCPRESVVGLSAPSLWNPDEYVPPAPLFNLSPPPGSAARLGFVVESVPVVIDIGLRDTAPYRIFAANRGVNQTLAVFGVVVEIWGVPADPGHDILRGKDCARNGEVVEESRIVVSPEPLEGTCPSNETSPAPFMTLPRSCTGPSSTDYEVRSWQEPQRWLTGSALTHDDSVPPEDQGFVGCGKLAFGPSISSSPTTRAAQSPTGLDFSLDVIDEGLKNPTGLAGSDIRKTVVVLPEGMTANPSLAEGLEVCSESQVEGETASSAAGAGCPEASKIGTVEVESPLIEDELKGSLYQAEPYENPFGTLIALYIVIKNADLGINIVQPLKVEPDPKTGQLISTAEEMPQLPFSHFRLHFREGGRSPLISPPSCDGDPSRAGDQPHTVRATLYPWSGGAPVHTNSTFEIVSGPDGGPCPPADPPFSPGFEAGTLNNAAGAHSPFLMRLTRRDGDQDLTRFDAVLPPGASAKLAGVPWCPEAAIARAKSRDGRDELHSPSCPPASQIGSVRGGAGVASQLTYVSGKIYLAGPLGGAPLSVVAIVPAVAGPFDVGTIVVRQALDLDPLTGQARVDGALSDPLPHILAGIPLNVRDIQVSVDRPQFTLNPTNCNEMATHADIWGGGRDVFSRFDDFPVLRSARFQAADCAALGFEPRLAIKLRGGVRRGAHPALRAVVTPRPGDANFSRAVVTLPRSAFLDQAHIRTICTRVQFAAGPGNGALCPKGARYGYARAWSPLLDAPAQGPVYLRSSSNKLPDLVVALKGPASAPVEVELSARIDSVRGGIRGTFTGIPDLPVSRFILDMQGAKKGLIVNSRHLCRKPGRNRARANVRGQNGAFSRTSPRLVAVRCVKRRKAAAKRSLAKRTHRRHLRQG